MNQLFAYDKSVVMEKVIEYTNGEITILWKPELCVHSGMCVQGLPNVYKPTERPWIKPMNASTDELIRQIDECPSKALSYKMNK